MISFKTNMTQMSMIDHFVTGNLLISQFQPFLQLPVSYCAYLSSIFYYLVNVIVLMEDMLDNDAAAGPTVQDWVTLEKAFGH